MIYSIVLDLAMSYRHRIIVVTFSILAVALITVVYYNMQHHVDKTKRSTNDISVVLAEDFVRQLSPQTESANMESSKQDKESRILHYNEGITGRFVRELRKRTMDRAKDPTWANMASSRLQDMVKDLPYLIQKPNVQCGSTDCEVSISTVSSLSEDNKSFLVEALAQPAFGDDKKRFLIVRQIWSNRDIGEAGSGLHAFYIKR